MWVVARCQSSSGRGRPSIVLDRRVGSAAICRPSTPRGVVDIGDCSTSDSGRSIRDGNRSPAIRLYPAGSGRQANPTHDPGPRHAQPPSHERSPAARSLSGPGPRPRRAATAPSKAAYGWAACPAVFPPVLRLSCPYPIHTYDFRGSGLSIRWEHMNGGRNNIVSP